MSLKHLSVIFFLIICFDISAATKEDSYLYGRIGDILGPELQSDKVKSENLSVKSAQAFQCFRNEIAISGIINNVIKDLTEMFSVGKLSPVTAELSKQNIFPKRTPVASKIIDEIEHFTSLSAKDNLSLKSYQQQFEINDVSLEVIGVKTPEKVNFEDKNLSSIQLVSFFDFRGSSSSKSRRQDRGTLEIDLVKNDLLWIVKDMRFKNVESLSSSKKALFQKSASHQIPVPVKLRTEAIRRGGYALSNADVNNDGHIDLLFAHRDGLILYMGKADGGYTHKKDSNLEKISYVKTAVFADLTNNGIKDLVITKLMPPSNKLNGTKHPASAFIYKGDGSGKFIEVPKAINPYKRKVLESMPATVADFNNDGLLDIYIGYPGVRDFTADYNPNAEKGFSPQGVYINKGNYKFLDFTDKFSWKQPQDGKLFPHASIAANFDHQHGVDLLVADDRGNLSPAYLSTGKSFKESAEAIGIGNRGYGMSIAVGDSNQDGLTDLIFTNVNFAAAERIHSLCGKDSDSKKISEGGEQGLRLFNAKTSGLFHEVTSKSGLENVGFGAAGVTFIDYNHDGLQDIYLVNGLWSGTKSGDELDSLFMATSQTKGVSVIHSLKEENFSGFKEFLSGANGNFNFETKTWKSKNGVRPSLSGYQRNKLFRNNGDSTFTEVGFFEGVDSISDGYVVGKADANNDGIEDLILRNSDPGTKEYSFDPLEIFINQAQADIVKKKSIVLRFEGVKSNRDGYGVYVIIEKNNGKKGVHHLVANSGSVQDESLIRFYLGKNETIKKMSVYWPSGVKDILYDVIPGQYLIKEGLKKDQQISNL